MGEPGTCRYCGLRRTVYPVPRYGGGTYRRAGRWYLSSICGECATGLVQDLSPTQSQVSRYPARRLRSIAQEAAGG